MSAKKKHRWTRPLFTVFVLVCGDCGNEWKPDRPEPKDECKPGPNKALVA